jgi:hypothetical protein
MKMDLLPKLTMNSIVDYLLFAVGLSVGYAILRTPMDTLQSNLKKQ